MPRGGRREGAGRKPGSITRRTRDIAEGASADGVMPLDYMLKVMRDSNEPQERRDEMAKAAAPYCHAKLQAVGHTLNPPDALAQLLKEIDGTSRGLPTPQERAGAQPDYRPNAGNGKAQ